MEEREGTEGGEDGGMTRNRRAEMKVKGGERAGDGGKIKKERRSKKCIKKGQER